MNFSDYEQPASAYPERVSKSFFTCHKCGSKTKEAAYCPDCGTPIKELRERAYSDYKDSLEAYRREEERLLELFWGDTFDDIGVDPNHPKAEILKEIAWDHGHSDGLYSVYNWVEELSTLLS